MNQQSIIVLVDDELTRRSTAGVLANGMNQQSINGIDVVNVVVMKHGVRKDVTIDEHQWKEPTIKGIDVTGMREINEANYT